MRSPVDAVAEFPFTSVNSLDVHAFELIRRPLAMDVLKIVSITNKTTIKFDLGPGSPVHMQWSAKGGDRFYGYVHSVRPIVDGMERRVEILCMGAFMPMLSPYTQVYSNMAPHNVAAEILDAHRLYLSAIPSGEVRTFTQNDDTDWEFLTLLARKMGYVMITDDVTLYFHPLADYWRRSLRRRKKAATFNRALSLESNLLSFTKDEAGAQPAYEYGIDKSVAFAELAKTGEGEGLKTDDMLRDMFPSRARATMLAPPRILPLDAYDVTNDEEQLTWAVIKVHYIYDDTQYQAEIEFGGNETFVGTPTENGSLDIANILLDQMTQESPSPILLNQRPVYVGGEVGTSTPVRWVAPLVYPPAVGSLS